VSQIGKSRSVVIFAHNEANNIEACLESVLEDHVGGELLVSVLANGCTDTTELKVRAQQRYYHNLRLISLPFADKANAWNHYVHELAPENATHFFVDGDIVVAKDALMHLTEALQTHPEANSVGAVPGNGKDRIAWTERMLKYGRLSGGLYALRSDFVSEIRAHRLRMPIGFIGDDFLISTISKRMPYPSGVYNPSKHLLIVPTACFILQSLSPFHPANLVLYVRRLIRDRIRSYQLAMLMNLTAEHGFSAMPQSVEQMYRVSSLLPRYQWRGLLTPLDILAVRMIRRSLEQ